MKVLYAFLLPKVCRVVCVREEVDFIYVVNYEYPWHEWTANTNLCDKTVHSLILVSVFYNRN